MSQILCKIGFVAAKKYGYMDTRDKVKRGSIVYMYINMVIIRWQYVIWTSNAFTPMKQSWLGRKNGAERYDKDKNVYC